MAGLTWLHLSDWHQRGKEFDRLVVRDALIEDIIGREIISPDLSKVDFIIFSGDLAFSGKSDEYLAAKEELLDPLLEACGLGPERLFIVPGVHDMDRAAIERIPNELRHPLESEQEVQEWLIDEAKRSTLLAPFSSFTNFVSTYTHQVHPDYACTRLLEISGKTVALLGLNSVWMSGRFKDSNGIIDDKGRIIVGEPQIYDAFRRISGADVKLTILHHSPEWLADFDRRRIENRLLQGSDFIFHGHDHESNVKIMIGKSSNCAIISAGAIYDRRRVDDPLYKNTYNFIHLDFDTWETKIFPRNWSRDLSKWVENIDLVADGRNEFFLKEMYFNSSIDDSSTAGEHLTNLKEREQLQDSQSLATDTDKVEPDSENKDENHEEIYGNTELKGSKQEEDPSKQYETKKALMKIKSYPLADTWSKIDLLYFSDYANSIVDFIKNEKTIDPLVIGIDAPWGMGKTTLMHIIEKKLAEETTLRTIKIKGFDAPWGTNKINFLSLLKGNNKKNPENSFRQPDKFDYSFPTIWFNAWKYDREKSLWAALVIEIMEQIKSNYGYSEFDLWFSLTKIRFGLIKFLLISAKNFIIPIILALFSAIWLLSSTKSNSLISGLSASYQNNSLLSDFINIIKIDTSQNMISFIIFISAVVYSLFIIKNIKSDPFQIPLKKVFDTSNYEERIGFIRDFQNNFSDIVSLVTKTSSQNGIKKLVIFIDDLDRCKPPKSVEIIEAISTILDANNCVFIIGMDSKMVALSIESKYKGFLNSNTDLVQGNLNLGKSFLEKIVQINFRIPNPSPEIFNTFINKMFKDIDKTSGWDSDQEYIKQEKEKIKKSIVSELGIDKRDQITLTNAIENIKSKNSGLNKEIFDEAEAELFAQYLFEEKYNLFEDDLEVLQAIEEAPKFLGPNPRKIKRFINNFRLQAIIANRRKLITNKIIKLRDLSKLIIIEMKWPELFDEINKNKNLITRLNSPQERKKLILSGKYQKLNCILESEELTNLLNDVHFDCNTIDAYLCLAQISYIDNSK